MLAQAERVLNENYANRVPKYRTYIRANSNIEKEIVDFARKERALHGCRAAVHSDPLGRRRLHCDGHARNLWPQTLRARLGVRLCVEVRTTLRNRQAALTCACALQERGVSRADRPVGGRYKGVSSVRPSGRGRRR